MEHIASLHNPWAGRSTTPSLVIPRADSISSSQVDIYDSDPLICRAGVKVCFGIQLLNAVSRVERAMPKLTLPFLLLQGSADRLCDSKGAYLLMESSRSQDKTLKVRDRRPCPKGSRGSAWLGSNGEEFQANELCDNTWVPSPLLHKNEPHREETHLMVCARKKPAAGHRRQCFTQAAGLPAVPQYPLNLLQLRVHRSWGLRTQGPWGQGMQVPGHLDESGLQGHLQEFTLWLGSLRTGQYLMM